MYHPQITRPTAFPARVFTLLPAPAGRRPSPYFLEHGDTGAGHDFLVQTIRPDLVGLPAGDTITNDRVYSCDLP